MARQHSIDRASADDVMSLVSDRGDPPLHVGAVLLLDAREGLDPTQLKHVLAQRLASIPRLRQRLIRVPIGCGRPVWVDYAGFQVHDHFSVVRCTGMRDEEAVLGIAAELLTTRLPHDRPLWAATLVTGVLPDQAALVFVFHHVLADGIAGLAVLGSLRGRWGGEAGRRFSPPWALRRQPRVGRRTGSVPLRSPPPSGRPPAGKCHDRAGTDASNPCCPVLTQSTNRTEPPPSHGAS